MGRIQNIRNRHKITNPHILELIKECLTKCKKLGFTIPSDLHFLECTAQRRAGLACHSAPPTIVLSTFIYKESDNAIKTIIYHELGHIIAGPRAKHGYEWQLVVNKISRETGLKITRCYSDADMPIHAEEKKKAWKYNFRCIKCGVQLHYSRLTSFVRTYSDVMSNGQPRWTCSHCHGTFELIK